MQHQISNKDEITTCQHHQSKLVSLHHYIVRKRQIKENWKYLSRKLKKKTENVKKVHHYLSKDEKATLKDIRN